MAREASGRLSLALKVAERNTGLGVGDSLGHVDHELSLAVDWASGTSDGQVDRVYSASGTASSSATNLDLVGSLSSIIGAGTVTFADVVAIVIKNTGDVQLRVGGNANAFLFFGAAADFVLVPPGGALVWYAGPAGLATVATTGDILQLATASGTTTYQLIVVGRSA